jgi:uncharacterized lipoprotein YehR (DUF1307 family)
MKFSNTIKASVLAIAGVFLLSGCVAYSNTDVKINDENNINVSLTVGFNKSDLKDSNKGEWQKMLDEEFKNSSGKVKMVDYEDNKIIGRTYTIEHATLSDIEKDMPGLSGDIKKANGGYEGSFEIKAIGQENAVFSVIVPGKIVTADNGAIIKDDKATWNLKTGDTTTIHFQSKSSSGIGLMITLLLLAVLLTVIIFGYFNRDFIIKKYHELTKKNTL